MKIGEGDGTVSLVSLGAMCAEGWKRKRWNPGGIKVVTTEVSMLSYTIVKTYISLNFLSFFLSSFLYLFLSFVLDYQFKKATTPPIPNDPAGRGEHERPRGHPRVYGLERVDREGGDGDE